MPPTRTSAAGEDRRVRALRPPKPAVDLTRPLGVLVDKERGAAGPPVDCVTVFLAGRECPFTCVFCDLWRHTTDGPTPAGAIPRQLRLALEEIGGLPPGARLKLYNASNFFDELAVPGADDDEILGLCAGAARVVVECHPKLVGRRCFEFAARLGGELEVAMGLETVHPEALPRLNKRMTVEDFDRAARRLTGRGIAVRAFVLIGVPFVPFDDQVEWAVRSVEHALEAGAGVVSLIPVRGGNGELERLAAAGEFREPRLDEVEEAFERALAGALDRAPDGALGGGRGVVQLDVWDLERLGGCPGCAERRRDRLARMALSGEIEPRVGCPVCGGGG